MSINDHSIVIPVCVLAVAMVALAGEAHNVRIDTSPDRVKTPLAVDMERIGTLRPRSVAEIGDSNWTIGCETLDRDFADFEQYKIFLTPLGIKTIRLQGGWAKCEREKGRYDFAWLDRIIDYACSQGLNVLLETGYGNPIYNGGGGKDLMGGFPTSDEALSAWDAWVEAMAERYKGRVRDWAMWNEPDIGEPKKSVEDIVAFNLRTAKIIKRIIPDSRIAGLSLAKNDPDRLEKYLQAMGEGVALFDWFIYHGYAPAPESSYENVEKQKAVLKKYSRTAKMRQGENGCPSEMAFKFTLKGISWSEYSQAKWNMRRMLGDLGHDVESSVFTICDFNHIGKEMNLKGLLRADRRHNVIAIKRAYYAVQNVAGVFDGTLTRVPESNYKQGFGTKDASITSYEYRKNTGERLFVFWVHGKDMAFERPGDSFETRPAVFMSTGEPLKDPVWVDLLSGRVYAFPMDRVVVSGPDEIRYLDVLVYDSPCVLTERSALEIDTGMNPDVARPCRDVRFSPLGVGTMLYGDPVHLVDGQPFAKDPTVIRLGGRYLMYYSVNDGEQWGGAIAESTNLVDWVRVGDIEVDGAPFKGGWVAPCVKKFDGKIHLFAQNPPPDVSDEAKKWNRIWHAVSDDGIHFAITPGYPVLGATGRWSNGRAIDAEAYRVGDKMMMAFATRNVDGSVQMQGLASSSYGSDYGADKWTELSVREPMLKPELPWEGHCIEAASVIERNGIWYMFYAGGYNHERQQIGLAWSADGVNFTRWRDTPVLPHGAEGSWNAWESGHPGVFEDDDGQIYLFYQGKATLTGGYRLSCLKVEFVD